MPDIEPIDAEFDDVAKALVATKVPATALAATLRMPESPYAQWPGTLDLGGEPIDCYVLDTGERVLSLRSAVKALAGTDSGKLGDYIGVGSLKPFINSELVLGELVEFSIPGTQFKGAGLSTANFELILRAYVRALYEKADLTDRQREIAIKCAGLIRSGLDELVDEATGYQYERAEDALQVKLRAFIADTSITNRALGSRST